jgi:hypothetical protein
MTHVANHEQTETVLFDELDNAWDGMTSDDMRLELYPLGLGLSAGGRGDFSKRRLASCFSSTTLSILTGRRGSSSTETMWSSALRRFASAIAVMSVLAAPDE